MANLKCLKNIGYSNISTLTDDDSAFFYESGMEIDADGAYHAYHPDGRSGLDYLGNAGRPGRSPTTEDIRRFSLIFGNKPLICSTPSCFHRGRLGERISIFSETLPIFFLCREVMNISQLPH
jgi:hypothetical protein